VRVVSLPKNTTQCLPPGFEPGPLDLEADALAVRLRRLLKEFIGTDKTDRLVFSKCHSVVNTLVLTEPVDFSWWQTIHEVRI